MVDFFETVTSYCKAVDLEYVEGLCDLGYLGVRKGSEVKEIKDGGYRTSILCDNVEVIFGVSPINETEGLTEETKDGARRSLLYALIQKAIQNR